MCRWCVNQRWLVTKLTNWFLAKQIFKLHLFVQSITIYCFLSSLHKNQYVLERIGTSFVAPVLNDGLSVTLVENINWVVYCDTNNTNTHKGCMRKMQSYIFLFHHILDPGNQIFKILVYISHNLLWSVCCGLDTRVLKIQWSEAKI